MTDGTAYMRSDGQVFCKSCRERDPGKFTRKNALTRDRCADCNCKIKITRTRKLAQLIAQAEVYICECMQQHEDEIFERQQAKLQRDSEAVRRGAQALSKIPPRIGKTERDRAKLPSGEKTNNPALSQMMKGQGGGKKQR